jgi:hypothetical protein
MKQTLVRYKIKPEEEAGQRALDRRRIPRTQGQGSEGRALYVPEAQ